MKILAICGSTNPNSSNLQFLNGVKELLQDNHDVTLISNLYEFDLFSIPKAQNGIPADIQAFKEQVVASDAVIISTPEYSHNIPAALKNVMDWCYESGEFNDKPTLAILLMPNEPRGKNGMECLMSTLKGQKAKVIAEMPMYFTDLEKENDQFVLSADTKEMILGAVEML